MDQTISYLAIPYTWNAKRSFLIANKVAAELMKEGKVIFSPVSHSHVIADHLEDLRYDQDFWMKQDLTILSMCDEIIVVVIGENGEKLISESRGCMSEIEYAKVLDIPISYYKYSHDS